MFEHEVIVSIPPMVDSYFDFVTNRNEYISERRQWCRENVTIGEWAFVSPIIRTCIFKFERAEDAVAFRLRFQ